MDKDMKLRNIYITCEEVDGKDAFRVEASFSKKKRSISQRAGWVPESYSEPEKATCTSVEELVKKIKEITKCCK